MNEEQLYYLLQAATRCAVRGDDQDWQPPSVSFAPAVEQGVPGLRLRVRAVTRELCDQLSQQALDALEDSGYAVRDQKDGENWEQGLFTREARLLCTAMPNVRFGGERVKGLRKVTLTAARLSALDGGGLRTLDNGLATLDLEFAALPGDPGQQAALRGGEATIDGESYLCAVQKIVRRGSVVQCRCLAEKAEVAP